jgi:hypothetical protein
LGEPGQHPAYFELLAVDWHGELFVIDLAVLQVIALREFPGSRDVLHRSQLPVTFDGAACLTAGLS